MILTRQRMRPARRGGFTIVELLVVVSVIVVLIGILVIALAAASSHARVANTKFLMNSIKQGLTNFQGDFGYLPPVLDNDRNYVPPPDFSGGYTAQFVDDLQNWHSATTFAEFLIGYGSAGEDGYNALGIRTPGPDRTWGAGSGGLLLGDRSPTVTGNVYGPYIEVDDNQLVGSIDPSGTVHLPTDPGFNSNDPKAILDYWGSPILYYPDHPHFKVTPAEVIALRPYQMKSGSSFGSLVADFSESASTAVPASLKSASYGLFSFGPDRLRNIFLRFDDPDDSNNSANSVFWNEDNIVEVGQ